MKKSLLVLAIAIVALGIWMWLSAPERGQTQSPPRMANDQTAGAAPSPSSDSAAAQPAKNAARDMGDLLEKVDTYLLEDRLVAVRPPRNDNSAPLPQPDDYFANAQARYSPDGRRVLMVSNPTAEGDAAIVCLGAETGKYRVLLSFPKRTDVGPIGWADNNSFLFMEKHFPKDSRSGDPQPLKFGVLDENGKLKEVKTVYVDEGNTLKAFCCDVEHGSAALLMYPPSVSMVNLQSGKIEKTLPISTRDKIFISDFQSAPDGALYGVMENLQAPAPRNMNKIVRLVESGGTLTPETVASGYFFSVAVSPSGEKAAYVSLKEENREVHVLDLKTQEDKVVTQGGGFPASWAPSGRHLLFHAYDKEGAVTTKHLFDPKRERFTMRTYQIPVE